MRHVYWENKEIPMPAGSHVNKNDGRVFIFDNDGRTIRESRRVTIGHATSDTMMHPNEAFRFRFPDLWEKYYGVKTPNYVLRAGLHTVGLSIGYDTNLYPILQDVYGPFYANSIMDFAIYSIAYHGNVAKHFPERMKSELCFSNKSPFAQC